jgi:hypothetical protein
VLDQQVDHRSGLDVVLGNQIEFGEDAVFANQIGDRVFKNRDKSFELLAGGFGLQILNGVELDPELPRDGDSVR